MYQGKQVIRETASSSRVGITAPLRVKEEKPQSDLPGSKNKQEKNKPL